MTLSNIDLLLLLLLLFSILFYSILQATENQIIKRKMLDAIFPDFVTNSNGVATYKGVALSTSAGPCTAQNQMPNAPVG